LWLPASGVCVCVVLVRSTYPASSSLSAVGWLDLHAHLQPHQQPCNHKHHVCGDVVLSLFHTLPIHSMWFGVRETEQDPSLFGETYSSSPLDMPTSTNHTAACSHARTHTLCCCQTSLHWSGLSGVICLERNTCFQPYSNRKHAMQLTLCLCTCIFPRVSISLTFTVVCNLISFLTQVFKSE
jgi:hypothetical protein